MEQHPVPRQITTFEFKLVGFMTLKQFIYLIVFIPIGYVILSLFPIPILNILLGLIVALFGVALAFVPINDRPMDVFIKNMVKRVMSPTQYFYQKIGDPMHFFSHAPAHQNFQKTQNYIDSQKKLANYLNLTAKKAGANDPEVIVSQKRKQLGEILKDISNNPSPQQAVKPNDQQIPFQEAPSQPPAQFQPPQTDFIKTPFITGVIKNNKQTPLPGILVYIKDQSQKPIRLLKSNPFGVFASFNPLPKGEYTVEIKDPKGTFFFDTMKVNLGGDQHKPFEFYSKELM